MATIYPFSIYTSQGKVYPASSGPSMVVDLNFLGWTPPIVGAQLESIDKIMTDKSFNLGNYSTEQTLYMFPDLTNIDTSDWNYSWLNFYNQSNMTFPDDISFNLSDFDIIFNGAFQNCKNLKTIEFSGQGVFPETVQDTARLALFGGCENLESITGLDLSNYSYLQGDGMFNSCKKLTTFTNCTFPTLSGVCNGMFRDCENLETLPFGATLDLTNVTDAGGMFGGCKKLTELPVITLSENVVALNNFMGSLGQATVDFTSTFPSLNVTIKFANNCNVGDIFGAAHGIASVTIDTENEPDNGRMFGFEWVDTRWMNLLKVYVPSSKYSYWLTRLKDECQGNSEREYIVENSILQVIS